MKKMTIKMSILALVLSSVSSFALAKTTVDIRNPTNYCGTVSVNYAGENSGFYSSTFLQASSGEIFTISATPSSKLTKVTVSGASGCGGTEFSGTINCTLSNTAPLKGKVAVNLAINTSNCLYCVVTDA